MHQLGSCEGTMGTHGCCSGAGHACLCGCGCGSGHGTLVRRFISKQEKLEKWEQYRDQLKKELTGVEEHIQELKSR